MAITEEHEGGRLDAVLAQYLQDTSRTKIKNYIIQGLVSSGSITITDPKTKTYSGMELCINLPPKEDKTPKPESIALKICYEDEDILVIEKPVGLVIHPAAGNETGTLVNALLHHCGSSLLSVGEADRPGIVHRLDKDTSGLLVVAKTRKAYQDLCKQFADHGHERYLERHYSAFVWGRPLSPVGIVDAPLARSAINREKMALSRAENAKYAITHYRVLNTLLDQNGDPLISFIRCQLETGRTHQIRVHMASIGNPVLGDSLYGSGFKTKMNKLPDKLKNLIQTFSHQALHAAFLGFEHPRTGEEMQFESSLPEDMQILYDIMS